MDFARVILVISVVGLLTGLPALCSRVPGIIIGKPRPPVWPSSYEVQYTFTLPYVQTVQVVGLKIPVHVWYDGPKRMLRMDAYAGLDCTYMLPDFTFNTFPRINEKACWRINNTAGPVLQSNRLSEGEGMPPLPDISGWTYSGTTAMPGGTPAYIWTLTENHWEKTNTYSFYTAQADGAPLRLYMAGVNLLSGSHFDEYLVDFTLFSPLSTGSALIFQPPSLCDNPSGPDWTSLASHLMPAQATSLLPSSLLGHPGSAQVAAVAEALHLRNQGAQDLGTELQDTHLLATNRLFVDAWNRNHAETKGFKLAVNRFASWSQERFLATRLGHVHPGQQQQLLRRQQVQGAYLGTFQRRLSDEDLPASVDYRGTGADGVVKDQASCGSCWAFATTGTMSGSWFKATGEVLSLSEQQIVDCSWDFDVNGCWGGYGDNAMEFIMAAGGAAMEDDYPYLGQNGYCKSNKTTKAAVFSGYQDIKAGDELAVMEALATRGPLYVGLDAVHPTFKFYSEGVYHREDCGMDADHQNHAVTLVGYGTTPEGVDYWLIRNSWSKFWGEDGYMKIARKGNDCGITVSAMTAVVDEAAAARARARVQSQLQKMAVVVEGSVAVV